MTFRAVDSIGQPANRTADLHARARSFMPADDIESAWQQIEGKTSVKVSAGPIEWGAGLVDTAWATHTVYGGTALSVSFPATTDSRWLYVQVDLNLAEASRVTVAFMANTDFPLPNVSGGNLIFKFPLSLWTCTAAGSGSRIFQIPRPAIAIPGWAPTRTT